MSDQTGNRAPLEGVKVLELGHVVAAPYATLMLSDLGADIVKVEHPDHGDHMRVAGDTARAIFASLNRDKRSVTLDLKSAGDRKALLDLVAKADVLVENFAPGALKGLELGWDKLREANDELVYISIKGYSKEGPYADRSATDPIIQAMSGLMSATGYSEKAPARAGTSVIDIATAQNAVIATLLALQRRCQTGTGEQVTVPLFETGVAMMNYWLAYCQQFGENPERLGASHSLYAPYDVYPTSDDGYVFIAAVSDAHWQTIKNELGLSLTFESQTERLDNRETIDEAIATVTSDYPRNKLVSKLNTAGVPTAPVNEVSDLVDDSHLAATHAVTAIDTREADNVVVPWTIPWKQAPDRADNPPSLGADTEGVLNSEDWNQS